jgi:hypothetical protein
VNKAQAHSVELLEIVDWADPGKGFNVKFTPDAFTVIEPVWTTGPHVVVNVAEDSFNELSAEINSNPKVCDKSGNPMPNVADVKAFTEVAHKNASDTIVKQNDQTKVNNGDTTSINKTVVFIDNPCIKLGNKIIPVNNCEVTGVITFKVHDTLLFKVLRKYGSQKPTAGCVMVETGDQSLMGISVNNVDNNITSLNIPCKDRLRKKIRGYKLSINSTKNNL